MHLVWNTNTDDMMVLYVTRTEYEYVRYDNENEYKYESGMVHIHIMVHREIPLKKKKGSLYVIQKIHLCNLGTKNK
jgi:hypothetical protein